MCFEITYTLKKHTKVQMCVWNSRNSPTPNHTLLSPSSKQDHVLYFSSSSPNLKYMSCHLRRDFVGWLPYKLIKRWGNNLLIPILFGKFDTSLLRPSFLSSNMYLHVGVFFLAFPQLLLWLELPFLLAFKVAWDIIQCAEITFHTRL